ncbi:MAG: endonuclease domain-containing protein [Methylococcaceae bacterium]|nr:endonuclease domain-containing protein [Methylococcaceae bacterium]
MKPYNPALKPLSRKLRSNMTDAEQLLWSKLRRKQILGLPFYRQKPIANYIVDFYCASANLVVELDGSQHSEPEHQTRDAERDLVLESLGLVVLRFDNRQVLTETDAVMGVIYNVVTMQIPPNPPFTKEEADVDNAASNRNALVKKAEPTSPHFENGEKLISPPFEKGGQGGFSKKDST